MHSGATPTEAHGMSNKSSDVSATQVIPQMSVQGPVHSQCCLPSREIADIRAVKKQQQQHKTLSKNFYILHSPLKKGFPQIRRDTLAQVAGGWE